MVCVERDHIYWKKLKHAIFDIGTTGTAHF